MAKSKPEPLLELSFIQKGSSICLLAFGSYENDDLLHIPMACVRQPIKKDQILKCGKIRYKAQTALNIDDDPTKPIALKIHTKGRSL